MSNRLGKYGLATDSQVDLGLTGEPLGELARLGDGPPHTLNRMTKVPLEAQYVAVLVTQQRPVHSSVLSAEIGFSGEVALEGVQTG